MHFSLVLVAEKFWHASFARKNRIQSLNNFYVEIQILFSTDPRETAEEKNQGTVNSVLKRFLFPPYYPTYPFRKIT